MIKEIDKAELVRLLNSTFAELNTAFFNNILAPANISVLPYPKTYVCYKPSEMWDYNENAIKKLKVSNSIYYCDLDYAIMLMLHAMVHMYNDTVVNVQDTSRGRTFHNKYFRIAAEKHGLIVQKDNIYGYSHTTLNSVAGEWVRLHGGTCCKFCDIKLWE